ncbi:hypothetical protein Pmani_000068 [Petrolisthes manimaculis]|uniref:Uncharacterized protein n=1 Tax=Petrolisthes manimaculis TaxID=1843537 RepID=A0AAE1QPV9_9EUCA|nr:hypothetical protein Pmani_000068 [Petrolisthes manimaculis]
MRECIDDFLESFATEFPTQTMKPKAHYMTHYADQVLQFGLLINCWTLRFEGKHSFFKNISRVTRNKINICKSLAWRHQMNQVERLMMITLSDRSQMIITQQASIVDVFHKYPWLMGSDLLVKELQRLIPKTETSDPRVSLCQGIARYKTPIIQLLQSRKNLPMEVKNILDTPPDADIYACKS